MEDNKKEDYIVKRCTEEEILYYRTYYDRGYSNCPYTLTQIHSLIKSGEFKTNLFFKCGNVIPIPLKENDIGLFRIVGIDKYINHLAGVYSSLTLMNYTCDYAISVSNSNKCDVLLKVLTNPSSFFIKNQSLPYIMSCSIYPAELLSMMITIAGNKIRVVSMADFGMMKNECYEDKVNDDHDPDTVQTFTSRLKSTHTHGLDSISYRCSVDPTERRLRRICYHRRTRKPCNYITSTPVYVDGKLCFYGVDKEGYFIIIDPEKIDNIMVPMIFTIG